MRLSCTGALVTVSQTTPVLLSFLSVSVAGSAVESLFGTTQPAEAIPTFTIRSSSTTSMNSQGQCCFWFSGKKWNSRTKCASIFSNQNWLSTRSLSKRGEELPGIRSAALLACLLPREFEHSLPVCLFSITFPTRETFRFHGYRKCVTDLPVCSWVPPVSSHESFRVQMSPVLSHEDLTFNNRSLPTLHHVRDPWTRHVTRKQTRKGKKRSQTRFI